MLELGAQQAGNCDEVVVGGVARRARLGGLDLPKNGVTKERGQVLPYVARSE